MKKITLALLFCFGGAGAQSLDTVVFQPQYRLEHTPAEGAQDLVIRLNVPQKALVLGEAASLNEPHEFRISAERTELLRQRGGISDSVRADLKAWARQLKSGGKTEFVKQNDSWILLQRDSLVLDEAATSEAIDAALKNGTDTAEAFLADRAAPQLTIEDFKRRGVVAHLSTGNSNYKGSSKARITNIRAAGRHFQNRFFSGDTFSFNRHIGTISEKNGFVAGAIIAGDKTETGLGGGVCQTSTTVFRALYTAGLPVVERHSHSYKVHFYQPEGFDAAIYQPTLDLRMKNDTGADLWFQSDFDDESGEFNVHVFGAKPSREVKLSEVKTISEIKPPASRTIYTTQLPKGKRQLGEAAATGGVTEMTRTIVQNGKTKTDKLRSSYRAWPATYVEGR